MMLDLLGPFPLFLLLLGSSGPGLASGAWAQLTGFQKFIIKHIGVAPVQCNNAMHAVNNLNRICKPQNTFLHDSIQNVSDTCLLPNIRCKNKRDNCHRSANPIGMTYCNLTGGTYPDCRYSTTPQYQRYTVACNPPEPGDPPYLLVPVHLDQD
ncbi:ribonuclease K3-like [Leptonychotes weddellii]|uniref:Ribonuclease K3-like n=1 Tax=Leptonychotes weddellii TaxID=9713 RepID=A0A7F8QKV8_LEPWE|nr:ribonuclease K3-like [Leptonychotes weddellii]